jgi:hypothetical protein
LRRITYSAAGSVKPFGCSHQIGNFRVLTKNNYLMTDFPKELPIDKGQLLILEPSICLLGFSENIVFGELADPLTRLGLEVVQNTNASRVKGGLINHTRTRIWVRLLREATFPATLYQNIRNVFGARLQWIGPAYRLPRSTTQVVVCPLPNALVIQLKPQVGKARRQLPDLNAGLAQNAGTPAPRLQEIPERSAYLNGNHYVEILNPLEWNAYAVKDLLFQQFGDILADIYFDKMPMDCPLTFTPNDTYFADQWNLARIDATDAWNFTTGNPAVVVALIDTGCDLTHPDLQFYSQGINCATMMPPGSEVYFMDPGHGTCTAGIAAAVINNGQGVSGIAGSCLVLPVASVSFSDTELAFGLNYAADNGANVISMSWAVSETTLLDMALDYALSKDIVLCAAAGNNDAPPLGYPASFAGVMAIGGSDQNDNRKTETSPDLECWGASYGDGLSVSAPCVQIWSTDIQGSLGLNNDGGPCMVPCVTYPVAGDAAGDYFSWFDGTSAATPHVGGFAALLRSQYPSLSGIQVRSIIERTADKVGNTVYTANIDYPNGSWNDQLGYGRINLFKGLDFADVFIKDFPADTGVEPRNPPGGDYWDFSDIVVRPTNDNMFNPSLIAQSKTVVRGQTNYIYVRVTNNGPNTARNVNVSVRITPYVGTQFIASDWTVMDSLHVVPATILDTFATLPAGGQVIATFSIDASQVETLWGWDTAQPWHPCLLALVQADNDYAFINDIVSGPAALPIQINNYAQRNLTVVEMMAGMIRVLNGSYPFIAGHLQNEDDWMSLRIDRGSLPKEALLFLSLDETGSAFPSVYFPPVIRAPDCRGNEFGKHGGVSVDGGEVIVRDGKRLVRADDRIMTVMLSKDPGQLIPLALRVEIVAPLPPRTLSLISISQLDRRGATVGGAGFAFLAE